MSCPCYTQAPKLVRGRVSYAQPRAGERHSQSEHTQPAAVNRQGAAGIGALSRRELAAGAAVLGAAMFVGPATVAPPASAAVAAEQLTLREVTPQVTPASPLSSRLQPTISTTLHPHPSCCITCRLAALTTSVDFHLHAVLAPHACGRTHSPVHHARLSGHSLQLRWRCREAAIVDIFERNTYSVVNVIDIRTVVRLLSPPNWQFCFITFPDCGSSVSSPCFPAPEQ